MDARTLDAVLAIAHHLLVFPLVAVLIAELALVHGTIDAPRLRQLGRLDTAYGALAGGVLVAGLLRAAFGAKGWSYYAGQPFFWSKLGLFMLIGMLSIPPTLRLIRWRKNGNLPDAAALAGLRGWMRAQAALLVFMPVLAVLMARGF